jgi:hypothetical protein
MKYVSYLYLCYFLLNTSLHTIVAQSTLNSQRFNVKDFGAVGDGTVDDAVAIQKTLNAANSAGGGIVYFPTGNYLVKTTLIPYSNLQIIGSGESSVLKFIFPAYSQTKKAFYGWIFRNQKNVTFRNIAMNGGATQFDSNPVDVDGAYHIIYFNPESDNSVQDIIIESCHFSYSFDSAIQSYGRSADKYPHPITNRVNILNCRFRDTGAHGVGMNEWHNSMVSNCDFENIGRKIMIKGYGSGMAVDVSAGSENIVVINNKVRKAAAGFKAETHMNGEQDVAAKNIIIEDNSISECHEGVDYRVWYGIRVNGIGVKVKRNTIQSYMHGILITSKASECVIENNNILSTRANEAAGIRIDQGYGKHRIVGNKINNAGAQGMLVLGNSLTISNNIISNSRLEGIRIADVKGVDCSNNICFDNKSWNISVAPINDKSEDVEISNNVSYQSAATDQSKGINVSDKNVINVIKSGNSNLDDIDTSSEVKSSLKEISNTSRTIRMDSPPTNGNWNKGDIIFNSVSKPGNFIGWICQETGAPGTWKGFGKIER